MRNSNKNNDERSLNSEIGLGILDHPADKLGLGELGLLKMDSVNKNIFIADSGASCHLTGSLEGIVNCSKICESVTIGNGQSVKRVVLNCLMGAIS